VVATTPAGSDTGLPSREPPPLEARERPPSPDEKDRNCGKIIYEAYKTSEADYPGCIFAIAVTEEDRVDFFTHRAYDRWWNMDHEDLSPMYFEATVRGRLEEDDEKRPVVILKEPRSVREYFEFKEVPEPQRSAEKHDLMVHDEYIRIARKLIASGLPADINVEVAGLQKYFADREDLVRAEPFPLHVLAQERLSSEQPH